MGRPQPRNLLLYVLFFLSGFSALIYEVLWAKQLSLVFGATMLAVSTVAATFMGGLACGSLLFGRLSDRSHNLLKLYALLEFGIAAGAILFPLGLIPINSLYVLLMQNLPDHPLVATVFRFIFAVLLLLPATVCMGGTLPVMTRALVRENLGRMVGRLYAVNTLGAALGCFSAGYVLVASFGLTATAGIAAAVNLLVGGAALFLSRTTGVLKPAAPPTGSEPFFSVLDRRRRALLVCTALTGAIALAYEILWTRLFLLFLGNTTYAFATILSVFLVGLALGSALYVKWARLRPDPTGLYPTLALLLGLTVLATAPFYDRLALLFQQIHNLVSGSWLAYSFCAWLTVFFTLLPATLVSGALFPSAVAILHPDRNHTGEGVGAVIICNTLGAIVGSFAATFLLLPLFGLFGGFRATAFLALATAVLFYVCFRDESVLRPGRVRSALLLLGIFLAILPFSWDQKLLNSGVYLYAPFYGEIGGIRRALGEFRLLQTIEGVDATVTVHSDRAGVRTLTVNGKADASSGNDMGTQILLSQLPLLLLPGQPHSALIIGLGSGITLGGAATYPLRAIDCVEISREVAEASNFFRTENRNVLDDPRVRLHLRDGRNFLLTDPRTYDVIVSEPSNPWQSGNANFFTDDFYRLAARRLNEGGIFCQWFPIYDLSTAALKSIMATFHRSFDHILVFRNGSDLFLLGSEAVLRFDYRMLSDRLKIPAVSDQLSLLGVHTPSDLIAGYYLFNEPVLQSLAGDAVINTDNHPLLEYAGRYVIGQPTNSPYGKQNFAFLSTAAEDSAISRLPLTFEGLSAGLRNAALTELAQRLEYAGSTRESRHFRSLVR